MWRAASSSRAASTTGDRTGDDARGPAGYDRAMKRAVGAVGLVASLALALTGCVRETPPGDQTSLRDQGETEYQCEEYTPTGSSISRYRCVEVEAADERRRKDQAWIQRENVRGRRPPPPPPPRQ